MSRAAHECTAVEYARFFAAYFGRGSWKRYLHEFDHHLGVLLEDLHEFDHHLGVLLEAIQ